VGLFKKMTDPSPGGGLTGDDPDAERRVNDSRDKVKLPQGGPSLLGPARVVDPTELIMAGARATGTIERIKPASQQINLQPTFEIEVKVMTPGGGYSANVIQPVAEEYLEVAVVGAEVQLKFKPEDRTVVWIDWAASHADG
jgi:hypothetical protein